MCNWYQEKFGLVHVCDVLSYILYLQEKNVC